MISADVVYRVPAASNKSLVKEILLLSLAVVFVSLASVCCAGLVLVQQSVCFELFCYEKNEFCSILTCFRMLLEYFVAGVYVFLIQYI